MKSSSLALYSAYTREYSVLCQSKNKDSLSNIVNSCLKISEFIGARGLVCLFSSLLEDLDFNKFSQDSFQLRKVEVLREVVKRDIPNLPSSFCQSLILTETRNKADYLKNIVNCLEINITVQIQLALALAQAPDEDWSSEGIEFVKEKLIEIVSNNINLSEDIIQDLLFFVKSNRDLFWDCASSIQSISKSIDNLSEKRHLYPVLCEPNLDLSEAFVKNISSIKTLLNMTSKNINLPEIFKEIGYAATASEAIVKKLLNVGNVDEKTVSCLLSMMITTQSGLEPSRNLEGIIDAATISATKSGEINTWNLDLLVDTIKSQNPLLNWRKVAELLDHEEFLVPDYPAFEVLVRCLSKGLQEHYPLETLIGKIWNNIEGQLSFLRFAVSAGKEIFSFEHSKRKMKPLDAIQGGKSPTGTLNCAWLSYDLMDILCKLGDTSHEATVMAILENGMKNCPEILILNVATFSKDWGQTQKKIVLALLPTFILPHPNSHIVLSMLTPYCRNLIIDTMTTMFENDVSNTSRILDVCQELKYLPDVLDHIPFDFAAELASLASRREYLNLEKWLKDKISSDGISFVKSIIKYLNMKLTLQKNQGVTSSSSGTVTLSVETLLLYFRVLLMNSSVFSGEISEDIKLVQAKAVDLYPQLKSMSDKTEQSEVFARDIEQEANAYFQKIYSEQTKLEDVISMLKRYKTSTEQREQEVFACMVHNLFDEYRFFPKYPDKALQITAVLFGQLIHHQLVSSITLGIALRYVLDALRKKTDTNMFKFGITAIRQFKMELPAWPQYCSHVLQIPEVREADPELIKFIENTMNEQGIQLTDIANTEQELSIASSYSNMTEAVEPPSSQVIRDTLRNSDSVGSSNIQNTITSTQQASMSSNNEMSSQKKDENNDKNDNTTDQQRSSSSPPPPKLINPNSTSIELAKEKFIEFDDPPDKIKDKVSFIFNNLSSQNLNEKIAELNSVVSDEYVSWLANYIVVKRAAQENNFHHLYIKVLDAFGKKKLNDYIIQATFHYVKMLLQQDSIKTEISDRQLLKNLGSWLGLLTLSKNKPVRQKDQDLKMIIYEAYENGKMIAVIPYVHKVLEQGKDSKVYGPNNPWIKGILTLLAEIYRLDGLKMNLTFEIEMIFKDFNISIEEIEPQQTLDSFERQTENNPDFYEQPKTSTMMNTHAITSLPFIKPSLENYPGRMSMDGQPLLNSYQVPVPTLGQRPGQQDVMPDMQQQIPIPRTINMSSVFSQVPPRQVSGHGPGTSSIDSTMLGALAGTLHQLVTINPNLTAIAERIPLKKLISIGIDRAIYEIITPVVERSVMIACTTTKELVTKDFAMEPDESKLRKAAHLMVSSLAGSLALVTCKEPLKGSLQSQLKAVLQDTLDISILDMTINIVIADNLDLGCTIIEKASTDKAIKEVDERLLPFYQSRQKARASGSAFYDMSIFTKGGSRFPASLPETLRPRPGQLNAQQTKVYDDFAKVPRPNQHLLRLAGIETPPPQTQQESVPEPILAQYKPTTLAERFALWQARLDASILKENQDIEFSQIPDKTEVSTILPEILDILNAGQNRKELANSIAEKLFIHMYENLTRLSTSIICAALNVVKSAGFPRIPVQVTTWFCQISQDEAKRFNKIVMDSMLRGKLVHFPDLDIFLARCLSNPGGPFPQSVDFMVHLIHRYMLLERLVKASDLANSLDILTKLAIQTHEGERIVQLIEQVKNIPRDIDPEGLRDQVAALFDTWAKVVHAEPTDKNIASCIEQFKASNLLKGDEIMNRFFRICTELSVLHCVNTESQSQQGHKIGDGRMSFVMIDSLVKLIVTLIDNIENMSKIEGLTRILEIVVLVLFRDHDDRAALFNSRPHFRIFYGLIQELVLTNNNDDASSFEVLKALASALISCRPQRVPGFVFSWMELMSNRFVMSKLLRYPDRKGWPYFRAMFMGLLLFMQPYLRHAELGDILRLLYKGVLRIMLLLSHDFPQFLCDYHIELCNVIPPSCVQMRNIVLSAKPRDMKVLDPFSPNLKMELLPDINLAPKILPDITQLLSIDLKTTIEEYFDKNNSGILDNLIQKLLLPIESHKLEGTAYNVTSVNCLVLYTGILALKNNQGVKSEDTVHSGPALDIFKKLGTELDSEGRYLFLNGIVNQLRYPNSHTHYFSALLLTLFSEMEQRALQEQITRVLLERIIAQRPHPWGLLVTFKRLVESPRYKFWELGITRTAPEIEYLFETLAASFVPGLQDIRKEEENTSVNNSTGASQ